MIMKDYEFSASHRLLGLPEGHPCERLHGHNYKVRVSLVTPALNGVGFVRDYRDLSVFKAFLDEKFDHRDLNQVLGDINPTAENLARFLYEVLDDVLGFHNELHAVGVSETPKTWAFYDAG